jgi:hypothetical protein
MASGKRPPILLSTTSIRGELGGEAKSTQLKTTPRKIIAPHHQASHWRLSRELLVLREHVTCAG